MIDDFEPSVAITTKLQSGFLTVQGQSLSPGGELGFLAAHTPYGFRSQPRDAGGEDGPGATLLIGYEGSRGHAWVLEDGRYLHLLPDEGKGGSIQYAITDAGKASWVKLAASDGAVTTHVDDASGPIRLEHGDNGPSIEINPTHVDLGGANGFSVLIDVGGALTSWIAQVSAFCGIPAPPVISSTIVRAKQ